MSYPLDSDVQEDVRTFPMYQRLRKINPYAYYSLQTQKQMQSDLRNFGSLTFFEQNIDDIPEVPEPTHSIELPKALADAERYHRIYPHIAINRLLITDQCVTSCC